MRIDGILKNLDQSLQMKQVENPHLKLQTVP